MIGVGFHAFDARLELFVAQQGIAGFRAADRLLGAGLVLGVDVALDEHALFLAGGAQLFLQLGDVGLVIVDDLVELERFLFE